MEAMVLGKRYTAQQALKDRIITRLCGGPVEEVVMASRELLSEVLPKQGYRREWLGTAKEDAFEWVKDDVDDSKTNPLSSRL